MSSRLFVASLLLSFGVLADPVLCLPTSSEVVRAVRESEQGVTSGEGTTVVQVEYGSGAKAAAPELADFRSTYQWAFDVPEWSEDQCRQVASDKPCARVVCGRYCGSYYQYFPDALPVARMQTFSPQRKVGVWCTPLFAQYSDLSHRLNPEVPGLADILLKSAAQPTGVDTVDGVPAVRMEGTPTFGGAVTYWLAPGYGYRVLKQETRWAADSSSGGTQWVETNQYSGFAQVAEGVWLPRSVVITKLLIGEAGPAMHTKITATITANGINTAVDKSKLYPALPPGTDIAHKD